MKAVILLAAGILVLVAASDAFAPPPKFEVDDSPKWIQTRESGVSWFFDLYPLLHFKWWAPIQVTGFDSEPYLPPPQDPDPPKPPGGMTRSSGKIRLSE
jgi:hypothetical protein